MDFGSGDQSVPDVDPDLEEECNPKQLYRSDKKSNAKDGNEEHDDENGFSVEEVAEGDQFMAVKPWLGVVKNSVPSNYKPSKRDGEAPDASL